MLVNRSPNGFFPSQRGLRQGDPLSPFLFVLAMEGKDNLINKAKEKGWIKGFQAGEANTIEITHLQYADDTLVFCGVEGEQALMLRAIFIIFEAVSGLHINWGKSYIYPINDVAEIEMLAREMGGRVGELPTTYLGMPLGAKSKAKGIWNGVLERCSKRLTNWKSQYLSLGGRVTLINSVLDALPSYLMSVFPMPASVIKEMNALRKTFSGMEMKTRRSFTWSTGKRS